MDMQFWLGVVSTIVLGLLVNLITDPIQAFLGDRSVQFQQRRAERVMAQYVRVKAFHLDRGEYQLFLMQVLIRIVSLVALGGLIYFYAGASQQLLTWLFGASARQPVIMESMASFQTTTTFVAFIVCLGTLLLCKQAIEVDKHVKEFPAYEAEVLRQLGEAHQHLVSTDTTAG
jgi:hypothetical protein